MRAASHPCMMCAAIFVIVSGSEPETGQCPQERRENMKCFKDFAKHCFRNEKRPVAVLLWNIATHS